MEMPLTYWMKEILSNVIRQRNGQPFPWDDVGDDLGVIATTDADLIFQLSAYEHSHTGGVVRITEGRYQELKKNSNLTASARLCARNHQVLKADQPQWYLNDPEVVAASAARGESNAFEAPVIHKAPETAVTVQAPVSSPDTPPPVSPSKRVRRGRATPAPA